MIDAATLEIGAALRVAPAGVSCRVCGGPPGGVGATPHHRGVRVRRQRRHAAAGDSDVPDQLPELVHILEAAVHRGKAHVGHLVDEAYTVCKLAICIAFFLLWFERYHWRSQQINQRTPIDHRSTQRQWHLPCKSPQSRLQACVSVFHPQNRCPRLGPAHRSRYAGRATQRTVVTTRGNFVRSIHPI